MIVSSIRLNTSTCGDFDEALGGFVARCARDAMRRNDIPNEIKAEVDGDWVTLSWGYLNPKPIQPTHAELKEIFRVQMAEPGSINPPEGALECARCRNTNPGVGWDPYHAMVCFRCAEVLRDDFSDFYYNKGDGPGKFLVEERNKKIV